MDIKTAAKKLGVKPGTVRGWARNGTIPARLDVGGNWIISPQVVAKYEGFISIPEAAKRLHVTRRQIYRLVKKGEINIYKLGGTSYINPTELPK